MMGLVGARRRFSEFWGIPLFVDLLPPGDIWDGELGLRLVFCAPEARLGSNLLHRRHI